jgi:hypothetical protein
VALLLLMAMQGKLLPGCLLLRRLQLPPSLAGQGV